MFEFLAGSFGTSLRRAVSTAIAIPALVLVIHASDTRPGAPEAVTPAARNAVALRNLVDGWGKLSGLKMIRTADLETLSGDYFRTADLSTVSAEDLVTAFRSRAFSYASEADFQRGFSRIQVLAEGADADASVARALQVLLARRAKLSAEARRALVEPLQRDPHLRSWVNGDHGDLVLSAVMTNLPPAGVERLAALDGLVQLLDARTPGPAVREVSTLWKKLARSETDAARREPARKALVAYLDAAAGAARRGDPRLPLERKLLNERDLLNGRATLGTLIGGPAPDLNFVWSSDPALRQLSALRGRTVALLFWSNLCGASVAALPEMRELVSRYPASHVTFIGVSNFEGTVAGLVGPDGKEQMFSCAGDPQRESELLVRYRAEKQLNWTLAVTERSVFHADYGVEGVPWMVIIGADGNVRHSFAFHDVKPEQRIEYLDRTVRAPGIALRN